MIAQGVCAKGSFTIRIYKPFEMKNTLLLLTTVITLLFANLSQGQDYVEVRNHLGPANSNTVEAGKRVTFWPGSSLKVNSGITSHARINPSLIGSHPPVSGVSYDQNPSYGLTAISTSYPVGSPPGQPGVNGNGASTFTMPVDLPNGLNGLKPSLSVAYNSMSPNGLLGYGFSISGIQAITRGEKNILYDKTTKGVKYNGQDAFYYNGHRLIPANGQNGENGTIYTTFNEAFLKITSNQKNAFGPGEFTVQSKDGKTLRFGGSDQNYRVSLTTQDEIAQWLLREIEDIHGNIIRYEYLFDNGTPYLKKILYNGNTNGLSPYTEVILEYQQKTDVGQSFVQGIEFKDELLLKRMSVYHHQGLYRYYDFKYVYRIRSCLKEIIMYNGLGERFNSLQFEFDNDNRAFATPRYAPNLDGKLMPADIDGDGVSDFYSVKRRVTSGTCWVGLSKKVTHHYYYTINAYINQGYGNFTKIGVSSEFESSEKYAECLRKPIFNKTSGDFNGDGFDDLAIVRQGSGNGNYLVQFFEYNSNTSSFNSAINKTIYLTSTLSDSDIQLTAADFNNDGIDDLLCSREIVLTSQSPQHDQVNNVIISNWKHNGYQVLQWWPNQTNASSFQPYQNDANADSIYVTDVNGNGIPDISMISHSGIHVYELEMDFNNNGECKWIPLWNKNAINHTHKVFPGRFNEDNKTDFLTWSAGSGWELRYSTGDPSNPFVKASYNLPFWYSPDNGYGSDKDFYRTGDFDGDGLTDVMEARYDDTEDLTKFYVFYRILDKTSNFGFLGKRYETSQDLHWAFSSYQVGDFNGDGAADVSFDQSVSYNDSYLISFGRTDNSFLRKVRDGLGNTTTFDYDFFSDNTSNNAFYSQRTTTAAYPYCVKVLPIKLVSAMTDQSSSTSYSEKKQYNYKNLVFHGTGLGPLGFLYKEEKDMQSSMTAASYSKLGTDIMLPDYSVVVHPSAMLKKNIYQNTVQALNHTGTTPATTTRIIKPSLTEEIDFEKDVVIQRQVVQYDANHNATITEVRSYNDLAKTDLAHKQRKVTSFVSNPRAWYPSYPELITVTEHRAGETDYSSTKKMIYDVNHGGIKKSIAFFGESKAIESAYTYDTYGNILSENVTSEGSTKSTTYEYVSGSPLVKKQTNPKGHSINFTYDALLDKPKEQISKTGNKTRFTHDRWGSLIAEEGSTGIIKTTKAEWSAGVGPAGTLYRIAVDYSEGLPDGVVYYNSEGQALRKESISLNNQKVLIDYQYTAKGQLKKESFPYFQGGAVKWKEYTYDNYGRAKKTILPNGNSVTTSYSGLETTVTVDQTGQFKTQTFDASGLIKQVSDNGHIISFDHFSHGGSKRTRGGANEVSSTYDTYLNHKTMSHRDAGNLSYGYNGFGEMTSQTDNGKTSTRTYDVLGRILTDNVVASGDNRTYEYKYDQGTGATGQMTQQKTTYSGDDVYYDYSYDANGRMAAYKEHIEGADYQYNYTHTASGEIETIQYPSGFSVKNEYDDNGYLIRVRRADNNQMIWEAIETDAYGRIRRYKNGNDLITEKEYDADNFPSSITTGNVQDFEFIFEPETGNLISRHDHINGLFEEFGYDDLDQLTSIAQNGGAAKQTIYSTQIAGRIDSKDGIGNYKYVGNGGNRLNTIQPPFNGSDPISEVPLFTQTASYTAFNKVKTLSENHFSANFTYGPDKARKKMDVKEQGEPFYSRVYVGGVYEIEEHRERGVRHMHYIVTGDGISAVFISNEDGEGNLYYLHRDYLGSITHITDEDGNLVEEYSYDAWGRRRNPRDWSYEDIETERLIDRGYTGHEHLFDGFNIINMSGRIYDPIVGMMMSPDNHIQDNSNAINYNSYAYAFNNPLKYTDPSGEVIVLPAVLTMAIYGAVAGATSYAITTLSTGKDWNWGDFGMATLGGAVMGAALSFIAPTSATVFLDGQGIMNALGQGFIGSFPVPSANIPMGDWTLSISPALAMGTHASGIGVNTSVAYSDDNGFAFGVGYGFTYYGKAQGSNKSTFESRFGGQVGIFGRDLGLGLSTNYFYHGKGSEFNQQVGGLKLTSGDFSASYENDGYPFDLTRVMAGQDNDRHRTAAASVRYKEFGIGFNLYTGDATGQKEEEASYHAYKVWSDPSGQGADKYRMGAVYSMVGNARLGVDSEMHRHAIQNKFAHGDTYLPGTDVILKKGQTGFKILPVQNQTYFQYLYNPFTLW